MNLPGFTAEASLYKTSERYQFAADWTDNSNDQAIIPQIPWSVLTAVCWRIPVFSPNGDIMGYFWWCR